MNRTLLHVLTAATVLVGAALEPQAADYQCRSSNGCTAQIWENGQLKTVNFRKGDIVCTEDGWVVSTQNGWKKLKPKKTV
jgi:hypothetical protein